MNWCSHLKSALTAECDEWPLKELGTLALQTDFNYQDDIFLTPDNSTCSQESYWLWNARVSFTSIDERWNISGWIKNIEDKVPRRSL